jgi:hypothetical protein
LQTRGKEGEAFIATLARGPREVVRLLALGTTLASWHVHAGVEHVVASRVAASGGTECAAATARERHLGGLS